MKHTKKQKNGECFKFEILQSEIFHIHKIITQVILL